MNLLCAYYLWLSVRCTRYIIHSLIILVFRASAFLKDQSFLKNPFFIGLLSCQCCTKAVGSRDDTGGKGGREVSSSASLLGRAGSELRPGCLALCPVKAWQSPGWSWHSLAGNPCPCPVLSRQGKGSPDLCSEPLLFQFHPPAMHCREEPGSNSSVTSLQVLGNVVSPLPPPPTQAISFPDRISPVPATYPHKASASAL